MRHDKTDALNEKVNAEIDLKMEEAYNELTDGKKEINDALAELNSRKTEIKSGQTDLESGQVELLDGKNELTKKQEEVTSQLAATKKDLLTVKTNLEVMKLNLSNNLTTAKSLDKSIQEIELIETAPNSYLTYYQQLMLSISGSDQSGGTQAKNQIALLKESYISNTMLTQVAGNNLQALGLLDWTDPSNFQLVYGTLLGISNGAGATLSQQKDNMKESINVLTNSMGLSRY